MNHEKYSKLIIYSWRRETFDPNSFAQVAMLQQAAADFPHMNEQLALGDFRWKAVGEEGKGE
jgi:hypothetical protein